MNEEFSGFTARVAQGEDGIYRWYYDMDMYQNKSMLYMLEKINLFTFLGISVCGALLIMVVEGDSSFARGFLWIGLALGALMALLYWIGFYIFVGIKRGNYRIHFAMREDGIGIVWPDSIKQGFDTGDKVMSMTGRAMGSRHIRGRLRPTLDEVSDVSFSTVIGYKRYPEWDMIDLSVLGGKFQVFVDSSDFEWVEAYILERVPKRVNRSR